MGVSEAVCATAPAGVEGVVEAVACAEAACLDLDAVVSRGAIGVDVCLTTGLGAAAASSSSLVKMNFSLNA